MEIILLIPCLAVFLIIYLIVQNSRTKSSFESKGVAYLGNGSLRFLINGSKGLNFNDDIQLKYELTRAKGSKIGGLYALGKLDILVADPELLKALLVKDFEYFTDFNTVVPEHDYLFGKMLIAQKGEKWKALRSKLSPTFTTGKIKRLFHLFDKSGSGFVRFLQNELKTAKEGELNLENGFSKYTMNVIAEAAMGMNCQAFDQSGPTLFEQMGKKLQNSFSFSGLFSVVKVLLLILLPPVANLLRFTFLDKEVQAFFLQGVKSSIKERQSKGERRDDFIQLMLEARDGKLKLDENELETFERDAMIKGKIADTKEELLDDTGIAGNSLLFLMAGFDTTQSLLLFVSYVLALNPKVQDRLRAELGELLQQNGGNFTYEDLHGLAYLEMVINETLRLYPPARATVRTATKSSYIIPGTQFVINKGDNLSIPIAGLQTDSKYWTLPKKFDPERFSPENKHSINPYVFLPFGQGPRNCIGMRFALTNSKVVIAHLVHNFKIEPSQRTLIPMKYSSTNTLKPEGGMFLKLTKL